MASSYITLSNLVLRRLNEVEIAEADFASVRGVQALVKDAIEFSIAKINQAEFEWPFNAAEHTQVLVAGQTEYTWPTYFKVSDWNSFQILENSSLGSSYQQLKYLERDEWYKFHRDDDYTAGSAGRGIPQYVFPSHGSGFGVTESPDAAYSVRFRYYLTHSDLVNAADVSRIPTNFDSCIVDGALYQMYQFKDNLEASQASYAAFADGLKNLQTLYINNYVYLRDTRVNF
jgi:hypothetical protein